MALNAHSENLSADDNQHTYYAQHEAGHLRVMQQNIPRQRLYQYRKQAYIEGINDDFLLAG